MMRPPRRLQEPPRRLQEGSRALQECSRGLQEGSRALQECSRRLQEPPRRLQEGSRALQECSRGLQEGSKRVKRAPRGSEEGSRGSIPAKPVIQRALGPEGPQSELRNTCLHHHSSGDLSIQHDASRCLQLCFPVSPLDQVLMAPRPLLGL